MKILWILFHWIFRRYVVLPQEFLTRMEKMLGEEYEAFLASYESPSCCSLRLNPWKTEGLSEAELSDLLPFLKEQVLWEPYGYYYDGEARPGKHPFHGAGVYYIQEASAMMPTGLLEVQAGERVLDLCAAPGGKSTQLAAKMQGKGILVCNEIHPARARILSENIERMGICNALVLNEPLKDLSERFEGYFDKILVDAPCSGEGMFRKNVEACGEWSPQAVELCAKRQDEILGVAAGMLREGGRMVYSTCTFAPEENEGSVSRFLHRHPDFFLAPASFVQGAERGRGEWIDHPAEGIGHTLRLFPHKVKGEGHFAAVLQKKGGIRENSARPCPCGEEKAVRPKDQKEFLEFWQTYIRREWKGILLRFGDQLYLAPDGLPSLQGLKVLRPGLHLGTVKKNRFEPSHALALSLKDTEAAYVKNLSARGGEAEAYLRGQTLQAEGEKGWYLITVDGFSLGWGKLAGGILKNHYPRGLRI